MNCQDVEKSLHDSTNSSNVKEAIDKIIFDNIIDLICIKKLK